MNVVTVQPQVSFDWIIKKLKAFEMHRHNVSRTILSDMHPLLSVGVWFERDTVTISCRLSEHVVIILAFAILTDAGRKTINDLLYFKHDLSPQTQWDIHWSNCKFIA